MRSGEIASSGREDFGNDEWKDFCRDGRQGIGNEFGAREGRRPGESVHGLRGDYSWDQNVRRNHDAGRISKSGESTQANLDDPD